MSERFIKFIPSEESVYLRKNHPNAFLLLSLIAERARRVSGSPDGLEIGEALIGDYLEAGIETEMKYRTAKKILEMRKHIKICETCRNRKKSTTGITTTGTKVKILRSDVWDINPECNNDRRNDRITTEQRPDNDEEERKRKNKNEKEHIITDDLAVVENVDSFSLELNEDNFQASDDSTQHNIYNKTTNSEEIQTKHELKQKKPNKVKIKPTEQALSLLNYFNESLAKHIPEVADPPKSQEARHLDKLLESYPPEEIKKVIDFSHTDSFWAPHVHDPNYLKLKFSKLMAAMRRKPSPQSQGYQPTTSVKEKILKHLEDGKIYNGYECQINQTGIGFVQGTHHIGWKFTDNGLLDQLNSRLRKMGVGIQIA